MELVFQECVQEVKSQGKSVFLSSHILSEVEKLCDRVSIIRQGKIIESGTLRELRHLTRTRVRVETAQPIPNLREVPGVHDVEEFSGGAAFQVDGEQMGRSDEAYQSVWNPGSRKLTSHPRGALYAPL